HPVANSISLSNFMRKDLMVSSIFCNFEGGSRFATVQCACGTYNVKDYGSKAKSKELRAKVQNLNATIANNIFTNYLII
ncbi:MAG: hypothetical protein II410_05660, partial [Ruminococcus sp.]|nr:hypothetical protein [Ruminococcus sp.]